MIYNKSARPFAIPTLVASLLWAWNGSSHSPEIYRSAGFFALEFVEGVVIFSLHAIFIKVALELSGRERNEAPVGEVANDTGRSDNDA